MKTKALILVAALFCTSSTYGQSSLTNGLIGWYPFNGNVNDASGQGRDGTAQGQIGYVPGVTSGSAAGFAGTGEYVELPGSLPILRDMTITFWLKTSVADEREFPWCTFLVSRDIWGPGYDWNIVIGNGRKLLFHTGDSLRGELVLATPTDLPSNVWVHVACVLETAGSIKRIFVDGQPAAAVSWHPVNFLTDELPIYVGASTAEPQSHEFFKGALADLRLYNRALTAEEIVEVSGIRPPVRVHINKAVWLSFSQLSVASNYQVQVSGYPGVGFTNFGSPFAATNSSMTFPAYWHVDDWDSLFFRLEALP